MKRKPPAVLVLLAVFAALLSLSPLGYLAVRVTQGADQALEELFRPRTIELLFNTFSLVLAVSITALAVGVFQAWMVTRAKLPFAGALAVLCALPLAIPSYISAFSYQALFPSLSGFWASWLILTLSTAPYVFLAVSASLVRTDSATEEVSRSLGFARFATFRKVTWPAIRPAATASTLLVALYTLGEFGAIAILRYDTFTRAIYNAYRSSFDRTAAATLALVLVAITLIFIFLEGKSSGSFTENKNASKKIRISLGLFKVPTLIALIAISFLGVLVPALSMGIGFIRGSLDLDIERLLSATLNSLLISTIAGLLIATFGFVIALLVVRYRSRLSLILERTVWITHALPAVVVGLALVFIGANLLPGVYQTLILLLISYLVLFLPNAISAMTSVIASASREISDVAASLGKTDWQILRLVIVPIAMPGFLAGFAVSALTSLKELPATLLLRPNDFDTLATRLWQATEVSAYSQAAPYALMLVLLGGLPALALNLGVRRALAEASK